MQFLRRTDGSVPGFPISNPSANERFMSFRCRYGSPQDPTVLQQRKHLFAEILDGMPVRQRD